MVARDLLHRVHKPARGADPVGVAPEFAGLVEPRRAFRKLEHAPEECLFHDHLVDGLAVETPEPVAVKAVELPRLVERGAGAGVVGLGKVFRQRFVGDAHGGRRRPQHDLHERGEVGRRALRFQHVRLFVLVAVEDLAGAEVLDKLAFPAFAVAFLPFRHIVGELHPAVSSATKTGNDAAMTCANSS